MHTNFNEAPEKTRCFNLTVIGNRWVSIRDNILRNKSSTCHTNSIFTYKVYRRSVSPGSINQPLLGFVHYLHLNREDKNGVRSDITHLDIKRAFTLVITNYCSLLYKLECYHTKKRTGFGG